MIRASGYRVKASGGGHYNTFLALEAADSAAFGRYAAYFDMCRSKRNELSYDAAEVVSETEVEELLSEVRVFQGLVRAWVEVRFPRAFDDE